MTQYNLFYEPFDPPGDEQAAHQVLAQHGTWSGSWWEPHDDEDAVRHILDAGYCVRRERADARQQAKRKQRSHIMRVEYWAHLGQVAEDVGAFTQYGPRAGAAGQPVPSWRTLLLQIGTGALTVVRTARRDELCSRVATWLAGIKLPPRLARQKKMIVRALRAMDPGELPPGLRADNDQER